MTSTSVYNMEGKEVDALELNGTVFSIEVDKYLIHLAVVAQLTDKRQGAQKAKARSEVSNGGRKPWRQKGAGHAGQGSTRSPQWRGGDIVLVPIPGNYTIRLNKKEGGATLRSALISRVRGNKLIVVGRLKFSEIRTREFQNIIDSLRTFETLMVLADSDRNTILSAGNIADVKAFQVDSANIYDILKYNTVVATKVAVTFIEEVYA